MKTNVKALLLLLCAVAIVAATAFGTLAYLTDTEAVTNTFAVGRVGLTLDEAKVNEQGVPYKDGAVLTADQIDKVTLADVDRWQPTKNDPEQKYYLLPGHSYTKDPTVTVDAGSENAYVRMMLTITYKKEADAVFAKYGEDVMMSGWLNIDSENWLVNGAPETTETETQTTRTYEFRYVGNDAENPGNGVVVKSETATKLPPLFTELTVPGEVTSPEMIHLQDMQISVIGHAIQAAGFDTADAAWTAFGQQHNS